MKKIALILIAITIVVIISCKKTQDVSTVRKNPSIELIGTPVYSTSVGTGIYVDPGAILTETDGSQTTLTTPATTADLTTPGFYSVTYKVNTKYGFDVAISRLVLVTPVSPADDYSGVYARSTNGQTVNITKHGTGLYTTDNVGGVAGAPDFIFDVYFGLIDDTTIVVPLQQTPKGDLSCVGGTLIKTATDTTISWAVDNGSFGTQTRYFVKPF